MAIIAKPAFFHAKSAAIDSARGFRLTIQKPQALAPESRESTIDTVVNPLRFHIESAS
jgi:hypothetical protein